MADEPNPPAAAPIVNPQSPSEPRLSWRDGATAQFVSLFLWIAFFDQLSVRTLPLGGFFWSVGGAAVGAILCAWLFAAPALALGWRTGKGFMDHCGSALGTVGANWGIGLAMIAAQVVLFGLAVHYGLDLTFRGLDRAGYLEPGAAGEAWRTRWVYPFSALAWCVTFGLIGMVPAFAQMIMTVTRNYAVFPALALGGFLVWALTGMRDMDLTESYLPKAQGAAPSAIAGWRAAMTTIQWQLAFFAPFAAFAVDWGRVHRTKTDVKLVGWIGVACSSAGVAVIALTAAAILGRAGGADLTWTSVTADRMEGWPSAIACWTFAVASMVVAVNAVQNWTVHWKRIAPKVAPVVWVSLGTAGALPIILTDIRDRADILFGVVGALIAPAVGIVLANANANANSAAVDSQPPIRWLGVTAWAIGVGIGLIGPIGAVVSAAPQPWSETLPMSLAAFFAGFAIVRAFGRDRRGADAKP